MENKSFNIDTKFKNYSHYRTWYITNFKGLKILNKMYSPIFNIMTSTFTWQYNIMLSINDNKTLKIELVSQKKFIGHINISAHCYDASNHKVIEKSVFPKNILVSSISEKVLNYDAIYIQFSITFTSPESTITLNKSKITEKKQIWNQIMKKHLHELYLNPKFSDVSIYVEDSVFPAHKTVLAMYSPVFRKMFSSGMREQRDNKIYINDCTVETFNCILCYIYTGVLIDLRNLINELIFIADMYEIYTLKEKCIQFFINNMNEENVLEILILATKLNYNDLECACLNYIVTKKNSILSKKEFDDIKERHVDIALKILDWIINALSHES